MTDREIRQWAVRVVDLYVTRTSMTLLQQGELEREVAAQLRDGVDRGAGLDELAALANRALDGWERTHRHRGSRVLGFSAHGGRVLEKRAA